MHCLHIFAGRSLSSRARAAHALGGWMLRGARARLARAPPPNFPKNRSDIFTTRHVCVSLKRGPTLACPTQTLTHPHSKCVAAAAPGLMPAGWV